MEGTIGEIRMFAGNFAPKNWAFCQGQLIAIQSNTALFSILGTYYGGNGTTTFGLPNLQGRTAVGAGQGPGLTDYVLGEMTGTENISLIITEMPAHTHNVILGMTATLSARCVGDDGTVPTPVNNFPAITTSNPYSPGPPDSAMGAQSMTLTGTITQVGVTGKSMPHNNLQPLLAMNYIVCMYGVYPARN